ncbi:F-box protein [Cardamine amara subsp. amara]|uniref:F-box protein n=1 Tax=Cardamine amara subsp. amara TaxID=228776 RepID=A0ABD1BRG3_CARAN
MNNLQVSEDHVAQIFDLPNDLIINILSRLPAKSIAKCRCVSKLWSSIFRRPRFNEFFPIKSSASPRFMFTFVVEDKILFFLSPQPQDPNENSSSVASYLVGSDHHTEFTGNQELCLPINGFVCRQYQVIKYRKVVAICNPITGESLTLPKMGAQFIDARSYFGFDPINKQFKVLCLTWHNMGIHVKSEKYQVMTLGVGKVLWRTIKCRKPHYPLHDGICINGVLYYRAHDVEKGSGISIIVCFDVRSEEFKFINLDKDMLVGSSWVLINYKGKLGAVDINVNRFMLVVLEDARNHKWSKHIIYKVPDSWRELRITTPLQFVGATSTGEIVLSPAYLTDPFYVYYYNLERNTLIRVRVQGLEAFPNHRVHTFLDYVEDFNLM